MMHVRAGARRREILGCYGIPTQLGHSDQCKMLGRYLNPIGGLSYFSELWQRVRNSRGGWT